MFILLTHQIIIDKRLQIQMRQNSLAMRLNSIESRPMSKFKKSKNALLGERKLESNTPKNQELNEMRLRQNNNKDPATSDRTSDKIKLITKLINKFCKKEERAIYQQLAKHFENQQVYRNHLMSSQIGKDRTLQATLKDIINKIIKKQQELVENWIPISSGQASPAQNNKCLIAREWSPKMHKFENNYTYGMFNKRNADENKEKENCKVQNQSAQQTEMFHRIFSHLDRLSLSANLTDSNESFKSMMKGLSTSMEEKQQLSVRIIELQAQLAKQAEKFANLSETNKTTLRQSNKFSTQLHQIIKENAYIKQKYRQIEEEFEVLVKEKLEIETELQRKEKQMLVREKQLQQSYQKKIMSLSIQKKEEDQSEKHDLEIIISSLENRIKELMGQIQENKQAQLLKPIEQIHRSIGNQRILQTNQVINYHWSGMSNQPYLKKELSLSKLQQICIQSPVRTQFATQKSYNLEEFQIIKTVQINIQTEKNNDQQMDDITSMKSSKIQLFEDLQTQTNELILRDQETFTNIVISSDEQSQTNRINFHNFNSQTEFHQHQQNQSQTENQIESINLNTNNSFHEETQTYKQCFTIQEVVYYKWDLVISKVNQEINTNSPQLAYFPQLYNYQLDQMVQKTFISEMIQTDGDNNQQSFEQTKQIEFLLQNEQKRQYPTTIISMLLEAEQCLIVPQIVFLREQILRYREQIEKMKMQVKIEVNERQKQKEEQNVFQFSL